MRKVGSAKAAAGRRRKTRARRRRDGATETALAMLAHEMRTPLNGILALSELIAAADLPPREREWANLVKGAAEHLAQLSTLVVDGVRADARGLTLRPETFSLRALATAVGGTLKARAETKSLATEIAITDDLPAFVVGDRVRLRAALENLADNAVKFTDRGSVRFAVEAKVLRGRHRVTFGLADSGIGLTHAEVARLFRPFAQASTANARRYGGAGLGLVFVKRLAEAMNGKLTVESRPGKGTTFRLTVTLEAAASPTSAHANAATGRGKRARALRILCAEDNPYARVVLNTILTELGHAIDFAGTGEAAVAAIERGGYDVALMDVTLPGMDGIAATRAIRALRGAAAQIPIIGISGHTSAGHAEAVFAAGMNAFLPKPVSPAALAEALRGIAAA